MNMTLKLFLKLGVMTMTLSKTIPYPLLRSQKEYTIQLKKQGHWGGVLFPYEFALNLKLSTRYLVAQFLKIDIIIMNYVIYDLSVIIVLDIPNKISMNNVELFLERLEHSNGDNLFIIADFNSLTFVKKIHLTLKKMQ